MSIVKIKGIPVELDGQMYVVPPIALGPLEQLQERVSKYTGDVRDVSQIATVIDAGHAALKRNYPQLTREDVAGMIDVGNMGELFMAVMDVSGLKRKEIEGKPGESLPG